MQHLAHQCLEPLHFSLAVCAFPEYVIMTTYTLPTPVTKPTVVGSLNVDQQSGH